MLRIGPARFGIYGRRRSAAARRGKGGGSLSPQPGKGKGMGLGPKNRREAEEHRPGQYGGGAGGGGGSEPAAYWRVYVEQNGGDASRVYCRELEFRGAEGGPDLATGGTPIAHSEGSGVAANAFDDSSATAWGTTSGSINPTWLGYQFASEVDIVEIAYTIHTDLDATPRFMQVDKSADGVTWERVWNIPEQTGWTTGEQRVFTKPATTQLRVTQAPVMLVGGESETTEVRATQVAVLVVGG